MFAFEFEILDRHSVDPRATAFVKSLVEHRRIDWIKKMEAAPDLSKNELGYAIPLIDAGSVLPGPVMEKLRNQNDIFFEFFFKSKSQHPFAKPAINGTPILGGFLFYDRKRNRRLRSPLVHHGKFKKNLLEVYKLVTNQ